MWEDKELTRFVSSHSSSPPLPPLPPSSRGSPSLSPAQINKRLTLEDVRTNTLIYTSSITITSASLSLLIVPGRTSCSCLLASVPLCFSSSITLSAVVSFTHSLTLSPLLKSHISPPTPPPVLSCQMPASHSKCLYLLLFLSFLPPSHSYLSRTVPPPCLPLIPSPSPTVFRPPPVPLR